MTEESPELPSTDRLRWQCRRGMLELDVLFDAFLDNKYDAISDQQKRDFLKLLDCPDPLIMAWVMGDETPPTPEFEALIAEMRSPQRQPG